jgi:hypothetical protein
MSWLDRVSQAFGGNQSRARQYASAGSAFGPLGMLGGFILGRYMDGRGVNQTQQAGMNNLDQFGSRLDNAIWGPGQSGNTPLLSSAPSDSSSPWYDDTTMSAADPLGLVPNYGGGDIGGGGDMGGMAGGRGDFGMLPGGGFNGVMNGASTSMMTDFAAPTNGDWMQRIGTSGGYGVQKPGAARR